MRFMELALTLGRRGLGRTWPNPAVGTALTPGMQGLVTGQKSVSDVLTDLDTAWSS